MLHRDRIKAAIFDMDGLMLDTEPIYRKAWTLAVADCGYTLDNNHYEYLVGCSNDDCDRFMLDLFGEDYPVDRCRQLRDCFWRSEIANNGIPLKPGLHELLDYLQAMELPTAIATASLRSEAALSLATSGIGNRFQFSTAGDEVPNNKPAPDIYIETARKLGIAPHECLVFEDSNTGATAAIQSGAIAIVVPDLQPPHPTVVEGSYSVVKSLHSARQLLEEAWSV
ncbi:MAG: HAD family hydrolase [Synechococcus sp.]